MDSSRKPRSRRRTWTWILLGLIVALIAIPNAVGMFLGPDFDATVEMEIPRSPTEVWAALNDIENNPCSSMRKGTEMLSAPGEAPVFLEDIGSTTLRIETTEWVEPTRIVREVSDQATPMTATWAVDVEASGSGSRVRVHATTRLPNGTWHMPMFRFMLTVSGGQEKQVRGYLEGIARSLGTEALMN